MGENDVISLKEYFDAKFAAAEKATDIWRQSLDRRLEGMNELREAMKDQQSHTMTREEYQRAHEALCEKIQELQEFRANLQGKASQNSVYIAWFIAIIGLVLSAISLFWKH